MEKYTIVHFYKPHDTEDMMGKIKVSLGATIGRMHRCCQILSFLLLTMIFNICNEVQKISEIIDGNSGKEKKASPTTKLNILKFHPKSRFLNIITISLKKKNYCLFFWELLYL